MNNIDWSIKGIFSISAYIAGASYVWFNYIGIDTYVMFTLLFFMILDMILGWIKAATVKGLDAPSSKIAKKGILTKLIMFVIPVVSGLIWGLVDRGNAMRVVNVLLTALTIAEGYSNIGNAYTIYTGEVLSEFDAFTLIIKKLSEKIKKLLESLLNTI